MPSSSILRHDGDHGQVLIESGTSTLTIDRPIVVTALGYERARSTYHAISRETHGLRAEANIVLADGTQLAVTDNYTQTTGDRSVTLDRAAEVLVVGSAAGVNLGLESAAQAGPQAGGNWELFLPCTLYNRNDSDQDGVEDYLGTYAQDVRDDKNGVLAALVRQPTNGATFSVARLSIPTFDTALSSEQLLQRSFIQETDIGSLGLAPRSDGSLSLRTRFPFAEESSFSLDTAGTGWQAYLPLRLGRLLEVSYEFRVGTSSNFTEAVRELCEHQRERLNTRRPTLGVSLEEALEHRQLLTQLYYRQWAKEANSREPAGYLVHFSPPERTNPRASA